MSELGVGIGEPCAALADNAIQHAKVNDFAHLRDAFAEENLKFGLAEWRRNLVFHHFHAGHITENILTVLYLSEAANVDTHRCVELQRITSGGGFGRAEHHAELVAKLVDEDAGGVGLRYGCSELAQGLRHESCLESHLAFAHIALNFSLWGECSHRVDHDDVDSRRADKLVGDFESLLAVVGL